MFECLKCGVKTNKRLRKGMCDKCYTKQYRELKKEAEKLNPPAMVECVKCKSKTKHPRRGLCVKCYGRERRELMRAKEVVYELPSIGEVHYSKDGKPICHICGRAYHKLLSHVWQIHGMNEKEYKKEFGLSLYNGIISDMTKEKLQGRVQENYEKVVEANLLVNGKKTRFKKGSEGRTRDKLSIQEYKNLVKRVKSIKN